MAGEDSPTDGRFRRGLYAMLLVLGLFAANSTFDARQAGDEVRDARAAVTRAEGEARAAREQVAILIEGQRAATARDMKAEAERAALLRRSQALEALLARLLASSEDAEVAAAFDEFTRAGASPAPAPRATPGASRAPTPPPRPSPQPPATPPPAPAPSPTCRLPVVGVGLPPGLCPQGHT